MESVNRRISDHQGPSSSSSYGEGKGPGKREGEGEGGEGGEAERLEAADDSDTSSSVSAGTRERHRDLRRHQRDIEARRRAVQHSTTSPRVRHNAAGRGNSRSRSRKSRRSRREAEAAEAEAEAEAEAQAQQEEKDRRGRLQRQNRGSNPAYSGPNDSPPSIDTDEEVERELIRRREREMRRKERLERRRGSGGGGSSSSTRSSRHRRRPGASASAVSAASPRGTRQSRVARRPPNLNVVDSPRRALARNNGGVVDDALLSPPGSGRRRLDESEEEEEHELLMLMQAMKAQQEALLGSPTRGLARRKVKGSQRTMALAQAEALLAQHHVSGKRSSRKQRSAVQSNKDASDITGNSRKQANQARDGDSSNQLSSDSPSSVSASATPNLNSSEAQDVPVAKLNLLPLYASSSDSARRDNKKAPQERGKQSKFSVPPSLVNKASNSNADDFRGSNDVLPDHSKDPVRFIESNSDSETRLEGPPDVSANSAALGRSPVQHHHQLRNQNDANALSQALLLLDESEEPHSVLQLGGFEAAMNDTPRRASKDYNRKKYDPSASVLSPAAALVAAATAAASAAAGETSDVVGDETWNPATVPDVEMGSGALPAEHNASSISNRVPMSPAVFLAQAKAAAPPVAIVNVEELRKSEGGAASEAPIGFGFASSSRTSQDASGSDPITSQRRLRFKAASWMMETLQIAMEESNHTVMPRPLPLWMSRASKDVIHDILRIYQAVQAVCRQRRKQYDAIERAQEQRKNLVLDAGFLSLARMLGVASHLQRTQGADPHPAAEVFLSPRVKRNMLQNAKQTVWSRYEEERDAILEQIGAQEGRKMAPGSPANAGQSSTPMTAAGNDSEFPSSQAFRRSDSPDGSVSSGISMASSASSVPQNNLSALSAVLSPRPLSAREMRQSSWGDIHSALDGVELLQKEQSRQDESIVKNVSLDISADRDEFGLSLDLETSFAGGEAVSDPLTPRVLQLSDQVEAMKSGAYFSALIQTSLSDGVDSALEPPVGEPRRIFVWFAEGCDNVGFGEQIPPRLCWCDPAILENRGCRAESPDRSIPLTHETRVHLRRVDIVVDALSEEKCPPSHVERARWICLVGPSFIVDLRSDQVPCVSSWLFGINGIIAGSQRLWAQQSAAMASLDSFVKASASLDANVAAARVTPAGNPSDVADFHLLSGDHTSKPRPSVEKAAPSSTAAAAAAAAAAFSGDDIEEKDEGMADKAQSAQNKEESELLAQYESETANVPDDLSVKDILTSLTSHRFFSPEFQAAAAAASEGSASGPVGTGSLIGERQALSQLDASLLETTVLTPVSSAGGSGVSTPVSEFSDVEQSRVYDSPLRIQVNPEQAGTGLHSTPSARSHGSAPGTSAKLDSSDFSEYVSPLDAYNAQMESHRQNVLSSPALSAQPEAADANESSFDPLDAAPAEPDAKDEVSHQLDMEDESEDEEEDDSEDEDDPLLQHAALATDMLARSIAAARQAQQPKPLSPAAQEERRPKKRASTFLAARRHLQAVLTGGNTVAEDEQEEEMPTDPTPPSQRPIDKWWRDDDRLDEDQAAAKAQNEARRSRMADARALLAAKLGGSSQSTTATPAAPAAGGPFSAATTEEYSAGSNNQPVPDLKAAPVAASSGASSIPDSNAPAVAAAAAVASAPALSVPVVSSETVRTNDPDVSTVEQESSTVPKGIHPKGLPPRPRSDSSRLVFAKTGSPRVQVPIGSLDSIPAQPLKSVAEHAEDPADSFEFNSIKAPAASTSTVVSTEDGTAAAAAAAAAAAPTIEDVSKQESVLIQSGRASIKISCRNLIKIDWTSNCDPIVGLFWQGSADHVAGDDAAFTFSGQRTELKKACPNPDFASPMYVSLVGSDEEQHDRTLKFVVFDVDISEDDYTHGVMGTAEVLLSRLLAVRGSDVVVPLRNPHKRSLDKKLIRKQSMLLLRMLEPSGSEQEATHVAAHDAEQSLRQSRLAAEASATAAAAAAAQKESESRVAAFAEAAKLRMAEEEAKQQVENARKAERAAKKKARKALAALQAKQRLNHLEQVRRAGSSKHAALADQCLDKDDVAQPAKSARLSRARASIAASKAVAARLKRIAESPSDGARPDSDASLLEHDDDDDPDASAVSQNHQDSARSDGAESPLAVSGPEDAPTSFSRTRSASREAARQARRAVWRRRSDMQDEIVTTGTDQNEDQEPGPLEHMSKLRPVPLRHARSTRGKNTVQQFSPLDNGSSFAEKLASGINASVDDTKSSGGSDSESERPQEVDLMELIPDELPTDPRETMRLLSHQDPTLLALDGHVMISMMQKGAPFTAFFLRRPAQGGKALIIRADVDLYFRPAPPEKQVKGKLGYLFWDDRGMRSQPKAQRLAMRKITQLLVGKRSRVLKAAAGDFADDLCFSIKAKKFTLHFVARDAHELSAWLFGINSILVNSGASYIEQRATSPRVAERGELTGPAGGPSSRANSRLRQRRTSVVVIKDCDDDENDVNTAAAAAAAAAASASAAGESTANDGTEGTPGASGDADAVAPVAATVAPAPGSMGARRRSSVRRKSFTSPVVEASGMSTRLGSISRPLMCRPYSPPEGMPVDPHEIVRRMTARDPELAQLNTSSTVSMMSEGRAFTGFFVNAQGQPEEHAITLFYRPHSSRMGTLYWCEPGQITVLPGQHVHLHKVQELFAGKQTDVLQHPVASEVPNDCCFSIVSKRMALNLCSSSMQLCSAWMFGILSILLESGQKTVDVDSSHAAAPSENATMRSRRARSKVALPNSAAMRAMTEGRNFVRWYQDSNDNVVNQKIVVFYDTSTRSLFWNSSVDDRQQNSERQVPLASVSEFRLGSNSMFPDAANGKCVSIVYSSPASDMKDSSSDTVELFLESPSLEQLQVFLDVVNLQLGVDGSIVMSSKSNPDDGVNESMDGKSMSHQRDVSLSSNLSVSRSRSTSKVYRVSAADASDSGNGAQPDVAIGVHELTAGMVATLCIMRAEGDVQKQECNLFYSANSHALYWCRPGQRECVFDNSITIDDVSTITAGFDDSTFSAADVDGFDADFCLCLAAPSRHVSILVVTSSRGVRDRWCESICSMLSSSGRECKLEAGDNPSESVAERATFTGQVFTVVRPSPATPRGATRQQSQDDLLLSLPPDAITSIMEEGRVFRVFTQGSDGSVTSSDMLVYLDKSTGTLGSFFWNDAAVGKLAGRDPDRYFPLDELLDILVGKQTPIFEASVAADVSIDCCLSLISSGGHRLEVLAPSTDVLSAWLAGLSHIVNSGEGIEVIEDVEFARSSKTGDAEDASSAASAAVAAAAAAATSSSDAASGEQYHQRRFHVRRSRHTSDASHSSGSRSGGGGGGGGDTPNFRKSSRLQSVNEDQPMSRTDRYSDDIDAHDESELAEEARDVVPDLDRARQVGQPLDGSDGSDDDGSSGSEEDDEEEQGQPDRRLSYRWRRQSTAHVKRLELLTEFKTLRDQRPQVLKHGRRGWPHKTLLHVAHGNLYWNWEPWKMYSPTTKYIALTSVEAIVRGRKTKVLRKGASKENDNKCFAVVSSRHTLNLQANSFEDRELWVSGLLVMVDLLRAEESHNHR